MTGTALDHPAFDHPPVVETVMGCSFPPIEGWGIPHFGLYWAEIRDRFPKSLDQPALPASNDDASNSIPSIRFQVNQLSSAARCWFHNTEETKLIQIQRDQFHFNCKRGLTNEPYPHYKLIRPDFEREWTVFIEFLEKNNLPTPLVASCEISYVNYIDNLGPPHERVPLSEFFPVWSGATHHGFLRQPELHNLVVAYPLDNNRGRLRIHVQPVLLQSDRKEMIQLILTAAGRPPAHDLNSILQWFDEAQDFLVRGFDDFTSEKLHQLWGVKSAQ